MVLMEACSTSKLGRMPLRTFCRQAEASSQEATTTRSTMVSVIHLADVRVGVEPLRDLSLQLSTCPPLLKIRPFNFVGDVELTIAMAVLVGGSIRSGFPAARVA